MTHWKTFCAICCLVALPLPALAQGAETIVGGDIFRSGDMPSPLQAARDVMAAGATVTLSGTIAGDAHAAGFDVDVDAATAGDLYAAGGSVRIQGPVGGDLTAAGLGLRTDAEARVSGNARLAGARLRIEGPIEGALVAAGGRITLNAPVTGDVRLTGETLVFGPEARIGGTLVYSAPRTTEVPERVLPGDRVTFQPFVRGEMMRDMREMWDDWDAPMTPSPLALVAGALITLGFFVLIGALCLALAPAQVRHLREIIDARPGMALVAGVLGLSVLFGLVPVSAMTVVGIPLVPIVILATVAVWILGYVLGGYVLAMRAMRGFGAPDRPAIWMRLLALVLGLTAMALLNFIPVLGWMLNFALVLLGIGGMTVALARRAGTSGAPDTEPTPQEGNAS